MKELLNKHVFHIFLYGFRIKTSVYVWTCDEQPRACEEHIRTIKNIQTYSKEFKWLLSCFNLKLSSWQYQTSWENDYTFMQDPYGGGEDSW